MRRSIFAVSMLALVSCGSDDDGIGGSPTGPVTSTPTPTPSPTPTPAPTPTPSPTAGAVTPFDQLIGTVDLQAANGSFWTDSNPPQPLGINAFGSAIPYRYNQQTKDIAAIDTGGIPRPTFTAADIDASAPSGTVRYSKSNGEQLVITQPTPAGAGLRWTRFIEHSYTSGQHPTRVVAVTGVPTPTSQIPTRGVVTFSRTVVVGNAYTLDINNNQVTSFDLSPSTLSASIDYSAQRITFTLTLIGQPAGASTNTSLITITGTTDFDGETPSITASPATYATKPEFAIAAALFGTNGAEAGGVFQYRGTSLDGKIFLSLVGRLAAAN